MITFPHRKEKSSKCARSQSVTRIRIPTKPEFVFQAFFLQLLKLRIIACLQLKKCYVASHDNQ